MSGVESMEAMTTKDYWAISCGITSAFRHCQVDKLGMPMMNADDGSLINIPTLTQPAIAS